MILEYLRRRIAAFGYAFKGLADLLRYHPHIHIHAVATVVVCAAATYLGFARADWIVLWLCIGAVWTAEAFNTSIEYLTDLVSPDYHPLAGKVKDVASAAVLLTCFAVTIVGILLFWPYLFAISDR